VFIIADFVTGVTVAIMKGEFSWKKGLKGIAKKFVMLIPVGLANTLDTQVLHQDGVLRAMVIMLFLSNDGISIIDNCKKIGINVPTGLVDTLKRLAGKSENKEEKGE
jgi:toxin secretion/phage lysis holin